jgi:hypothetical protein
MSADTGSGLRPKGCIIHDPDTDSLQSNMINDSPARNTTASLLLLERCQSHPLESHAGERYALDLRCFRATVQADYCLKPADSLQLLVNRPLLT